MSVTASCRFPLLEEWKAYCDKNRICEFIDSVLSGYAQIAFSDNTFSALIMILAAWIGSPVQCISAVWATFVSTLFAYITGVPRDLIRSGLYGFNGALSGLALPLLLFPGESVSLKLLAVSALAGILCVFLTTTLRSFFGKWNVPALSSPYCVSVSIILIVSVLLGVTVIQPVGLSDLIMANPFSDWTFTELIYAMANGASQVLWVEKPICGVLYFAAVLCSSRIDAINTIVAVIASTTISVLLGLPKDAVMIGIYGFNSVLLMQVIARGFLINRKSYIFNVLMATFTPIVCVIFKIILSFIGVNTLLAFPYVTVCIIAFLLRKKFKYFTYVPGKYWGVPETIKQVSQKNKIPFNN